MRITVISGARRCGVDCADGEDLLSVLRKNGFLLPAGCGGRGTCGKCRVRVSGGRYGVRGCFERYHYTRRSGAKHYKDLRVLGKILPCAARKFPCGACFFAGCSHFLRGNRLSRKGNG